MDLGNQYGANGIYDYRKYDRIWQRVSPDLNPYPDVRQSVLSEGNDNASTPPAELPGAETDPCCMGSIAQESLTVLDGFLEEGLSDRRYFLALAKKAPTPQFARVLQEIAAASGEQARRLGVVHYLITGVCYQPNIVCEKICFAGWCSGLREAYHKLACNGLNYIRAADSTTDPCLTRLLNEFSICEYRHADRVMHLLEHSLRQSTSCTNARNMLN